MLKIKRVLIFLAGLLFFSGSASAIDLSKLDPENLLYLDLPAGRVVIMMRPLHAPNHVARVKELVRQGFYDGLVFHRVIDGFMAQTGDPNGDGTGGSGQKLDPEFNKLRHMRGTVSMARANDPGSADSQFFIVLKPSFFLDGQYTAWGRVIGGMQYVDAIKKGDPNDDGKVTDPDAIVKIRVAADVDGR
ncbi:MAG: peptidylprolyl isomerase [Sphingomonadales bacterium]